jgi:hypothetical protein
VAVVRLDPTLAFPWGELSPDPAIEPDTFSMRWTGYIEPRYSEVYTFYALADDGIRLWINDQLIIDLWAFAPTEHTGVINLLAGVRYPIRVEYVEADGPAQLFLSWSSTSQGKEIVPQSQLYQFVEQATPTPVVLPTPVIPGTGNGLFGQYYNALDFTQLALNRTDPVINFPWSTGYWLT